MDKSLETKLDKLNIEELVEVQDRVSSLLETKKLDALLELRKEFEEKAQACNASLDDVLNVKLPKTKSKPKYRNTENPDQTWTGKGRPPLWMGIDADMTDEEKESIKSNFKI